jgi:hypothetical protein
MEGCQGCFSVHYWIATLTNRVPSHVMDQCGLLRFTVSYIFHNKRFSGYQMEERIHAQQSLFLRNTPHFFSKISAYHHQSCEFEPRAGGVYTIQHYVIKFVSYLRQVVGFRRVLRFPPSIKLTATFGLT